MHTNTAGQRRDTTPDTPSNEISTQAAVCDGDEVRLETAVPPDASFACVCSSAETAISSHCCHRFLGSTVGNHPPTWDAVGRFSLGGGRQDQYPCIVSAGLDRRA